MTHIAYDDGRVRIELKCACSCWYCLCTLEGHCGSERCGQPICHPEDRPREHEERDDV